MTQSRYQPIFRYVSKPELFPRSVVTLVTQGTLVFKAILCITLWHCFKFGGMRNCPHVMQCMNVFDLLESFYLILFVCLGFIVILENFVHSYWDVTVAGEGLRSFTYSRHSWILISEGSLTRHIYCDAGLSFIIVISEDPWHSHLLPRV